MGLDDDDRTLLHGASVHGRPDVVLFQNKNGPNRDARDRYGLPALHEASRNGHVEVVECWRTWRCVWSWGLTYLTTYKQDQMISLKLTISNGSSLYRYFLNKTYSPHVSRRLNRSSTSTLNTISSGVWQIHNWRGHTYATECTPMSWHTSCGTRSTKSNIEIFTWTMCWSDCGGQFWENGFAWLHGNTGKCRVDVSKLYGLVKVEPVETWRAGLRRVRIN